MALAKRKEKDMSVVRRTSPFAKALKEKQTSADLKNYAGNGLAVRLEWEMNEASKRDSMMVFRIGDKTAIIDLEELLSYTRLM